MPATELSGYFLSDVAANPQQSRAIPNESPRIGSATAVTFPSRAMGRKLGAVHEKLGRVVDYLWNQGQRLAETAEQRDAYTLSLALLGAVRRGESEPLQSASYSAFGSSLPVYYARRAERQWRQHEELVQASRIRRPEAEPGHVHAMPKPKGLPKQKPVQGVLAFATAANAGD